MLSSFLFKTAGTDISLELDLEGFECGTWGRPRRHKLNLRLHSSWLGSVAQDRSTLRQLVQNGDGYVLSKTRRLMITMMMII